MKKKFSSWKCYYFILYLLIGAALWAEPGILAGLASAAEPDKHYPAQSFKVVGYYSGDLFDEPLDNLPVDRLTHIIYAFLIPKTDGTLEPLAKPEKLRELTAEAHREGAKVFIALGGWSYNNAELAPVFESLAAAEETRAALVENVIHFIKDYELDGLELDWEHPKASTIGDYEKLVLDLKEALLQEGAGFTAALNGAWSAAEGPEPSMLLTDQCLQSFDFINVMCYDINNEDHSPIWFTETSIDYWLNRGVAAENIVVGMPLYARPSWMQYRHLVELDQAYAYADYAPTTPAVSYYNGLNTLREKTLIALRRAGGVMLFDVNEDTLDETSVIAMIADLLERTRNLSRAEWSQYITVMLEGQELVFNTEDGLGFPFIDENNRIMMPLRKLLEAAGAGVGYEEASRIVFIEKDGIIIKLPVEKREMTINGQTVTVDAPAIIKEDRTYIPLRAVLTALGYEVSWRDSSRVASFAKTSNF